LHLPRTPRKQLALLSSTFTRRLWVLLTIGLLSLGAHAQVDTLREYILGPGDVLKVTVYQNADLTLETRVSESGTISYPLLGSVKVGGLTVTAAEKLIADGLRTGNFLKAPQVNVAVAQVRGHQASVLGLVNKPGRYPIEVAGLKLSDLIAMAGGVATGGSEIVTLVGTRDGKAFRQEVDLPSLFGASSKTEDPVVLNGDIIYVDRVPTFYIYGEVLRGGQLRLERGMTVMQALAAGGGVTQRGTQKGMKLHRRDAAGNVKILDVTMETPVLPNDVIYVRESLF
jgi:polysaccharide export outer membrane protein